MKKIIYLLSAALLVLGILSAPAAGREPKTFYNRVAKIAQEEEINFGAHALININNMSMWFKRDGYSAGNPYTDNSGTTYPRSTDQVIYRDGLVWGGRVLDGDPQELRVGGSTYAQGTVPGRIISKGVADDRDNESVRIYRVRRDYKTADLRQETAEYLDVGLSEVSDDEIEQLRAQYEKDWNEWPAEWGAPYYDNDGDGQYDPAVDEPGVASADQVAWYVVNDLDPGATQALYGAKPIGIEEQILMWAYARTDALGDAIFKKYTLIYKGHADTPDDARIVDMYFAQWSDPDLGDYGDDFVGSDIELSLGYVYNSNSRDSAYDNYDMAPPAAGYDFLQGPIVPVYIEDEEGNQVPDENSVAIFNFQKLPGYRNLPMTAFVYFAAGSAIDDPELNDYNGTKEWYNLLRGYEPQPDIDNPQPYTNEVTGEVTTFTMSGDPTRATGWNDGVPLPAGDRRMVLATGPFELALGDTQEVVVALLGGSGGDQLRSVSKLKFNDQFVQDAYNNLFEVPKPPIGPKIKIAELDGAILLDWGFDAAAVQATESQDESGFLFEGYNLYQLPAAESTLSQSTKLATFDLENGVATILGIALDEDSGVILDVPLQVGTDAGIRRFIKITQDAIDGGPLVNGQEYYFAVTAYNRNTAEGAAVTTLESSPLVQVSVPQTPPPGKRYLSEADQVLEADHTGTSEGSVVALVVDPTFIQGHDYQVTFGQNADGEAVWNLRDVTTDQILLAEQLDQTGSPIYLPDIGFEIIVSGPPLSISMWDWLRDGEPSSDRWLSGVDWGGATFFGGMDIGANFFGSSITQGADFVSAEIRFSPTDTQKAYRYLRGGDPSYGYQDFVEVPFTVWDIDSEPARQINAAFVENSGSTSENGAWMPADAEEDRALGGREYLVLLKSDYSDTALPQYSESNFGDDAESFDALYATWLKLRGDHSPDELAHGQVLRITPYRVNTPADEFTFTIPGTDSSDELAKQDVELINVFPNPYYGVNEAETSPYSHFVTFSHLPPRATIRIYDLSGTMVRKLTEEDKFNVDDQFLRWDLTNHNELPVASGLYIAHIELPDINKSKVLKFAIVQEQQFLENF